MKVDLDMNSTSKFNSDKFAYTDPSQLREVEVVSERTRIADSHHVSASFTARVSVSASKSASERNSPPLIGNLKDN